jgi:hypothetical protein
LMKNDWKKNCSANKVTTRGQLREDISDYLKISSKFILKNPRHVFQSVHNTKVFIVFSTKHDIHVLDRYLYPVPKLARSVPRETLSSSRPPKNGREQHVDLIV